MCVEVWLVLLLELGAEDEEDGLRNAMSATALKI